jgi:hypothetical protein
MEEDDINMSPKPVPIGEPEPPGSRTDAPHPPPEAEVVDNAPAESEPETNV